MASRAISTRRHRTGRMAPAAQRDQSAQRKYEREHPRAADAGVVEMVPMQPSGNTALSRTRLASLLTSP
jgi:hypothetical protein